MSIEGLIAKLSCENTVVKHLSLFHHNWKVLKLLSIQLHVGNQRRSLIFKWRIQDMEIVLHLDTWIHKKHQKTEDKLDCIFLLY